MPAQQHLWWLWTVGGVLVSSALFGAAIAGATRLYAGRIFPNVAVGPTTVGGLTNTEAAEVIRRETTRLLTTRVALTVEGKVVGEPRLADLGLTVPVDQLVTHALEVGRRGRGIPRVVDTLRGFTGVTLPLRFVFRRDTFDAAVAQIFVAHATPARSASWTVTAGQPTFVPSAPGRVVGTEQLKRDILRHAARGSRGPVAVRFIVQAPDVSDAGADALRPAVERLVHTPFVLTLGEKRWDVPARVIQSALTIERQGGRPVATLAGRPLVEYLTADVAPDINQPAENARFEFAGGRASVFQVPREGVALNVDESIEAIRAAAARGASEAALVVARTTPEVATTADLERLGIRTLLGRGESDFAGSPRNRIHNIRVGAARYHGVLIPPGAEFSFNEHLGPVTAATGYRPELVILENVTTPQYGGGLCQVSTTAFRAAILSGLKITARRNHAYPVSYYGTPGFDATIYPPSPDLKFLNDTPGHILIQTKVEDTKLIFAFWGTSDGREVRLVGPSPYGRRRDGAVRATLTQQIYQGGALVREETFHSSYKSPRLFPRVLAANAEQETWEARVRRIAEKDRKAREEFLRQQAASARQAHPTPTPPVTEEP